VGNLIRVCFSFILFFTLISSLSAHTFNEYVMRFQAFAKKENKWIKPADSEAVAVLNWQLAYGNWQLARRLAAEEAWESKFRVLAFLPEGTPLKGFPRSDLLGSHYDLMAQEAHRIGVIKYPKDWYYSDEFDALKVKCWADPVYGTRLVGTAYVRKAQQVGMDRASHWWQSGKSWFKDRNAYLRDSYLNDIWAKERLFDKVVTGRETENLSSRSVR
jgi:hypothetical protein